MLFVDLGKNITARSFICVNILFVAAACGAESRRIERPSALSDISFDTVAVIGAFQGQPWEVFGSIDDVVVRQDGYFAVLDRTSAAIHVFDAAGGFTASLVSSGEGPGEIRYPYHVNWMADDRLLVLDSGNARMSYFRLSGADLSFEETYRTTLVGDICSAGPRLFIHSPHNLPATQVIHELNDSADIERSFSSFVEVEISGSENAPESERMSGLGLFSESRLLCAPEQGGLLEVGLVNSRVAMHEFSGDPGWSVELEGILPYRPAFRTVQTINRIGLSITPDEATGSHYLRSAVLWDDERVLLQYTKRWFRNEPPANATVNVLESRLLQFGTGAEEDRSFDLPLLVAVHGDHFFQVRDEPFPQLIIVQRTKP